MPAPIPSDTIDTMELWATRVKNADPATFVGQLNRIFYYPDSGTLRISDGVTPGGLPINLTGNIANIAIANFVFNGSTITTSTVDSNITIENNGTGNIDLVSGTQVNIAGAIHVHADGNLANAPAFDVATTGDVTILAPAAGYTSGVNIIGSSTSTEILPQNTGVMLHLTGQDSDPSRIYNDGNDNYAAYIGRRYNGSVGTPTQVLDGELISRIGATPYTSVGWPPISTARVDFVAHGTQTGSNYGSNIEFWTTAANTITLTKAAWFNGDTFYANNVTTSGCVSIIDTNVASNVAVITVTNNQDGNTRRPVLANVIAQFTGQDNKVPYIVYDGYGNVGNAATGGEFTFRTARGNLVTPAAVQNNDKLGAIGGAGWGTTGYGGVYASHIEFQAAGTFTDLSRPGKIVFKAIPDGSTTQATVLTVAPTTAVWNNGMVMSNAWINLPGGTSTQAPLTFTASSTLNANPSPGSLNFDGRVFYGVPTDSERGIIPAQQQFVLNAARNLTAGTTAAQSMFGVTCSLSANTRYFYEINLYVAKNGSGSNQPTLNYGISPTVGSLTSHFYTVNSSVTATVSAVASGSQMFNYITTGFATGVPVTAAMPISVSYAQVLIKGYIDVNTAATVDFQLAFSDAPNTSCSVQPRSGVIIYPVSAAGQNTSTGTWA